jgi:predicted O-methyltransferase YrrM
MTEYPNWFAQTAQGNFEHFLTPLAGQDDLKFLQLGVFTGDASVWLLENILTGEYSELTDVDTWEGSDEEAHESMDFDDVYKTYFNKISKYKKRFNIRRCTTVEFLLAQYGPDRPLGEHFDFIYVDADHTTVGVLLDAELSWLILKSGGIMAFDDYTWGHASGDPRLAPQVGIDLFLHRHQLDLQVLAKNNQVWVKKK